MCEYTKITRRVKFDITILLSKKQLPHPLISTTGSKRYLANPLSVVTTDQPHYCSCQIPGCDKCLGEILLPCPGPKDRAFDIPKIGVIHSSIVPV